MFNILNNPKKKKAQESRGAAGPSLLLVQWNDFGARANDRSLNSATQDLACESAVNCACNRSKEEAQFEILLNVVDFDELRASVFNVCGKGARSRHKVSSTAYSLKRDLSPASNEGLDLDHRRGLMMILMYICRAHELSSLSGCAKGEKGSSNHPIFHQVIL